MYKISLSSVRIPPEAKGLIAEAFDKGLVGQSEYVERFEQMVADFVGSKHCIAVSNGTMADAVLVGAMKELYGIQRVVVPALTFIAQPNSVRYNGMEVVFADVGDDWLIDLDRHFSEYDPAPDEMLFVTDLMGKLAQIPDGQIVLEDACEAFGSRSRNGYAGTFSDGGTFSFFPSHTISTGEGGAIVTDDAYIARMCRKLRAHGSAGDTPDTKFTFPYLGFNARMTTMQACLGIALMEHVQEYIDERLVIFALMREKFGGFDCNGHVVVPHAYPLDFQTETRRNFAMSALLARGIECRRFFSCIPRDESPYRGSKRYPVAERIAKTHLYIPCHQNLTAEDVEYMARAIQEIEAEIESHL